MDTDRMILEALLLREMVPGDYTGLYKMLKDLAVMYAYEHAFSDAEIQ